MSDLLKQNFAVYFPIIFELLWLAVTTMLGFVSGWYFLMRRYPDFSEDVLCIFARKWGSSGPVRMRSILTLGVCPSGLRIGMMRIFGVFCRDFFVPWNELSVTRKDVIFWKTAKLSFGLPAIGYLVVAAEVADRLACAAGSRWPEPGAFPEETSNQASSRIVKQWLVMTCVAAAFFIVVPRLVMPTGVKAPPIMVAALFPAIVFGVASLVQYLRRDRR